MYIGIYLKKPKNKAINYKRALQKVNGNGIKSFILVLKIQNPCLYVFQRSVENVDYGKSLYLDFKYF